MTMANDQASSRVFYFDFLRALAIFAVIVLHLSADTAGQYGKAPTPDWLSAAFYNGRTRCCVPLFVLLSGALLLNPNKMVSIKELFTRRLPKLVVPLIIWSVVYEVFQLTTDKGYGAFHLIPVLKIFYQGPLVFHFWFLYMMIGIYLIYPVINAFIRAATKSQLQYFIAVWFAANCVLGIAGMAWGLNIGIDLNSFTGYIGYFVLGYYLNSRVFTRQQLTRIYIAAAAAFIISIAGIILLQACHCKGFNELIESDFTPDIPFALAGVVLLVKNHVFNVKAGWRQNILSQLSRESYGIYIVHVLFLRIFFDKIYLGLSFFAGSSLLWVVPPKALVVLIFSFGLTKLIRMIPGLRATV